MNSSAFSAADMTTAAANGFRDGLAAQPAAAQEAVVWGIRIGASDSWGYTNNEEQADFIGKQSGLPYEKKPLYAAPVAAAPIDGWDAQAYSQMAGELEAWKLRAVTAEGDFNRLCNAMNAEDGPTHMGEPVLSTPAAPGIDLDSMVAVAVRAWGEHQANCNFTTLEGSLRKVCEAVIDASPKGGSDACIWADDGEGNWHTACGDIFTLMEGSPADNKMHHCPYCGKNLQATSAEVGE